mgnify:CR=1 FL=1
MVPTATLQWAWAAQVVRDQWAYAYDGPTEAECNEATAAAGAYLHIPAGTACVAEAEAEAEGQDLVGEPSTDGSVQALPGTALPCGCYAAEELGQHLTVEIPDLPAVALKTAWH